MVKEHADQKDGMGEDQSLISHLDHLVELVLNSVAHAVEHIIHHLDKAPTRNDQKTRWWNQEAIGAPWEAIVVIDVQLQGKELPCAEEATQEVKPDR